ncbi:MAG: type II secretion system F family protein [Alphaproteobacteria bacterium]|nr:type II secretion system F family protein [Alphaproteobacteria bacterium]
MFGALGGLAWAFTGPGVSGRTQKRMAAVAAPAGGRAGNAAARSPGEPGQRRKNVTALLKEIEKQQKVQKQRPSLRKRLARAGLAISPRGFWIASAIAAGVVAFLCFVTGQNIIVVALAAFAAGFGLPRWVVGFLTKRRQKKFTQEFANAIDVIVRSVRSGLPTNDALKIVAKESPDPVGSEFRTLLEGLKVGVSLDQGLKRMYDSMPTAEVSFFAIVMTIQLKSGGNLSEALSNLSAVLRDRKRLQGKIKAMSSEAKASAGIIVSLPPVVGRIVFLTSPDYISLLFTERVGNLLLAACAVWMGIGIAVMRKMINFKH